MITIIFITTITTYHVMGHHALLRCKQPMILEVRRCARSIGDKVVPFWWVGVGWNMGSDLVEEVM